MLKLGSADLVLRMIEAGVVMRDIALENPIRAIREISHDMTGRRVVKLANGRELSAGCRSSASTTSGRRRSSTARAWTTRCTRACSTCGSAPSSAIETQDLAQVGTEIDWVMKYLLLDRYAAKHGLSLDEPADRPARPRLPRHQPPARAVLPAAAARAGRPGSPATSRSSRPRRCPPQTTRAKLRGDFIRAAQEHRRDFTVDWVHLKLNDQAQRTVLCKDPFAAVDARVERLIESM